MKRVLAVVAVVAGIGVGCFSEHLSGPDGVSGAECRLPIDSPAIGSVGAVVAIRNFDFEPNVIRIPRGARVTWLNCENPNVDQHTSTSDDGVWDSPLLSSGESYSRVFDQVGTFDYHCVPHPSMVGMIIVE
jgi:plastocyanin